MPKREIVALKGTVADIFAHRFVLDTPRGRMLADLTPKGAERVRLRQGDELEIVGEARPSEIKVLRVKRGDQTIEIEYKAGGPGAHHDQEADPERAVRGARAIGFAVIGRPSRKPKHFEVLGRDQEGAFFELHIEFEGRVRKSRRIEADDPKWEKELRGVDGGQSPSSTSGSGQEGE